MTQGVQRPRRLLFVDFAPAPGGSVQSLFLLLRHLPRQRYDPLLLLSPSVAALPETGELGAPVFRFDAGQGTPVAFRASTGQVRASAAAAGVRESQALGWLWRWGSIGRRLWHRTRHTAAYMARLIAEQQIEVVHLNDALPLAEPGILAAWRTSRPSIVTVRSFTPLDPLHRRLSRLPAGGVFTSEVLREDQRRQGASFRREWVIPNAVSLAAYAAPADREGVRQELGLPDGAVLAVVAGRLMRRKGLDNFLRAVAELSGDHPLLIALIVGETDPQEAGLEEELRALAGRLGIGQRVRFTGYRTDVPRLLAAADMLCFVPTEPEPFGRTLIEGMAAGLPVIGSASGAIPDIVKTGETGLLVPPSNPLALAAAMRRLLTQPDEARRMGQAGRLSVSERYSIAGQVEQYCRLYDTVLAAST